MFYKNDRPHIGRLLRFCLGAGLALVLALSVFSPRASAISLASPSFQVSAGFGSRYQQRDGVWVPVQVTLHNDGPDFNGKISINPPTLYSLPNQSPTPTYQQSINLPTGSQKQVTLYIPLGNSTPGTSQTITVDLLDNNNQKISSQQASLRSLGPGDLFIGILSNQSTGFGALSQVQLPGSGSQIATEPLKAATMPSIADALKSFDLIILDHFDTASLNKDQLAALERWVAQGGTLILAGGPEWRGTLTPLPSGMLPVDIHGTTTLPTGAHLFPVGGPTKSGPTSQTQPSDAMPAPLTVSTSSVKPGSTVLQAAGNTPLIVQSRYELGTLYYLAFDPQLEPVASWSNASYLWKGLLIRAAGDQFLNSAQNFNSPIINNGSGYDGSGMEALLQSMFPNAFPATWLILVLLLSYILILGPARLLLVRLLKNRDWSWRVALATIVVFSLLSYGLALQQKGTSIISSTISVIQLSKPDASNNTSHANIATYIGVFVPSQGDFQVHIAGNDQVQTINSNTNYAQFSGGSSAPQRATVTSTANGTNVELQGVETWTVRSLVSRHETQVKGGISAQLTLNNNMLSGTVTNTLPYGLNDAYVLVGDQYLKLGHLAASQSMPVNLQLNATHNSSTRSIADQIASAYGLQQPYSTGYYGSQPPKTDAERHMAMLSTLSRESSNCAFGPCGGSSSIVITSGGTKQVLYNNGNGFSMINGRDPLLLPNAPATLIGWADRTPDGTTPVTINGSSTSQTQDAFIQAPLDMSYSGTLALPPAFATSQLVDVQGQGTDLQSVYPGIYLLGGSSALTFEYTLPAIPNPQSGSLTISEPSNLLNNIGTNSGTTINAGTVDLFHVYLYNWKTGSWDAFSFTQSTFTVNDVRPYIGPGGRLLLQVANQANNQGQNVTIRPWLELHATS
ncbi:MAG: hypothetical protein J2P37_08530 [Ktedonobacteraceae bacterium]|nr:hypothetical protein [Ktedonobacteraceae bacterium]